MTASVSWHARIDCGGGIGAGFLVSARHVLTCAHVLSQDSAAGITVTFPQAAALGEVPARVVANGGPPLPGTGTGLDAAVSALAGAGAMAVVGAVAGAGDLAVLELARDVTLAPAEFAPPDEGYGDPPRKLLVYGFPGRYAEGTLAEYRTTGAQLIADEWVQLEAWNGHGQPLAPGFSGAAAFLEDTGRVVGMVSSMAGARGVRNGRMLPSTVMARYWPLLGDLIPTRGVGRAEKEMLRRLVVAAESDGVDCAPDRLYAASVDPVSGPPLPPQGFPSLWAAAWFLLREVDDDRAPAEFATRLADFVDDTAVRHGLQQWAARHRTRTREHPSDRVPTRASARTPARTTAPADAPAPTWSPIVIELARSGAGRGQLLVEVSAYPEGQRRVIGQRTLPKARVRAYVAQRIDEALRELPYGPQVLLAFVLPRELLNEPVAHWPRGAADPSPLGCVYPLVVMDRERRSSGGLQHGLVRKWQRLDAWDTAGLYRVECGSSEDQGRLTVRLWEDGHMMGFTAPPKTARMRRLFAAGLNGSVPVLLWPSSGCPGGHPDDEACAGSAFLDSLVTYVRQLTPAEMPLRVRELRKAVYLAGDEKHWARDLSLLWEDPRCLPEPPPVLARSPVA